MIELMILPGLYEPGRSHRCRDSGGSDIALQDVARSDEGSRFHLHKMNPVAFVRRTMMQTCAIGPHENKPPVSGRATTPAAIRRSIEMVSA
jgi:hypothetical protein